MSGRSPFLDPYSVQWPGQFITSDGCLADFGVVQDGQGPYGLQGCDLCGWHDENRPLEPSHILAPAHKKAVNQAKLSLREFWQELTCPDKRPYYYCHLTNF